MKTPPPSDDPSAHDDALDALFAAARVERPDTSRAEFGFETRLLARLAAKRSYRGGWAEFSVWCWRLIPAFAVITLAAGLWTTRPGSESPNDGSVFFAGVQPLPSDDDDHLAQWLAVEWLTPI